MKSIDEYINANIEDSIMNIDSDIAKFLSQPRISNVIFYPRSMIKPAENTPSEKFLTFLMEDGIEIGAVMYHYDYNSPTIILFHGNGEIAADYRYGVQSFFDCGVNLLVCDFRGYGFSSGSPDYIHLIQDALPSFLAAQSWLKTNKYKSEFFVMGRSLGSICVAEIGGSRPEELKGIIFESGFSNSYRLMLELFQIDLSCISPAEFEPWSNRVRIAKINHPVLVIHGTADNIVPYTQGEGIFTALSDAVWKKMISIEHAGHNTIQQFHDIYFPAIQDFLNHFRRA